MVQAVIEMIFHICVFTSHIRVKAGSWKILFVEYMKFHKTLAPIVAKILFLALFGQKKIVADSGK